MSEPIKRILLVADRPARRAGRNGNVDPVLKLLGEWWLDGAEHATLICRGTDGLEKEARRWWANRGATVETPQPGSSLAAEVENCCVLIAAVHSYGDTACQALWHTERLATGSPIVIPDDPYRHHHEAPGKYRSR